MPNEQKNKRAFDLEHRTMKFALDVRALVQRLTKTLISSDDIKQLLRSSGSVGANYIDANEALSKKDFFMRIKICRKESKESRYWLLLIQQIPENLTAEKDKLIQEATELMKIFNAIIQKM